MGRRVLARLDAAVEHHRLRRDRAPAAALASVNWLHLMAFAFTLAVVADTVVTLSRARQQRGTAPRRAPAVRA